MTGSAGWQTVVSRICPSGRRLDTFVAMCDPCLDRQHAARRAAEEAKHHRSPGSDPFMRAFFVFVLICVVAGIAVYFIASLQSAAR